MITNDINILASKSPDSLETGVRKESIYSMFLNPKGRIITDAIITRPIVYKENGFASVERVENEFFIDIPLEAKEVFLKHVGRYTWKKKVSFEELDVGEESSSR